VPLPQNLSPFPLPNSFYRDTLGHVWDFSWWPINLPNLGLQDSHLPSCQHVTKQLSPCNWLPLYSMFIKLHHTLVPQQVMKAQCFLLGRLLNIWKHHLWAEKSSGISSPGPHRKPTARITVATTLPRFPPAGLVYPCQISSFLLICQNSNHWGSGPICFGLLFVFQG
jgi:hypothetical protein